MMDEKEIIGTIMTVLYPNGEVQRFTGTSFAFVVLENMGEETKATRKVVCDDNIDRLLLYNFLRDMAKEMLDETPWLAETQEVFEATLAQAEGGADE